jgi:hypothetical protein
MAGRILNRRALREQADYAEQAQAQGQEPADQAAVADAPAPKARSKAKKPAAAKTPKVRAKKAPPRMCARWGVFDGGMKQVAIFDYNQRAAADAKLADLMGKQKGIYFLQLVKEEMPEPVPVVLPAE